MRKKNLAPLIIRKDVDKADLADKVIKDRDLLPDVIDGLQSQQADLKFGCAKIIRIVSEQEPALVYPHIEVFIDLLDSDNNILKWNGIGVLANLASVDRDAKIDKVLRRYLAPIKGDVMITAANVMAGAAKIALAKPELTSRIENQMLKVEDAEYQTPECRDVALGHAIAAFDQFFDQAKRKKTIRQFVQRQLDNSRNATAKKAEKFLRKWGD